mmetsp:Transcript_14942/g.47637  ORF Transcript_14942/g.47637 Transcript_14942/m.47637 type:complete len:289 (+) Transcript_14942:10-876(+)
MRAAFRAFRSFATAAEVFSSRNATNFAVTGTGALVAATATVAACARLSKDTVYEPGQAVGEGLRGELWKARHENVDVLELQEEGGENIKRLLTIVRSKESKGQVFRFGIQRMIRTLVDSAFSTLPIEEVEVETPDGYKYQGLDLSPEVKLCGIAMSVARNKYLDKEFAQCLDGAPTATVSVEVGGRRAKVAFQGLPEDVADRHVFVLDANLRSGRRCVATIDHLIRRGVDPEKITVLAVVASRDAIEAICNHSSDVKVVVGAMDMGVDSDGCVVPGMGSLEDRYFREA